MAGEYGDGCGPGMDEPARNGELFCYLPIDKTDLAFDKLRREPGMARKNAEFSFGTRRHDKLRVLAQVHLFWRYNFAGHGLHQASSCAFLATSSMGPAI
jgi:hypothetical protein